MQIINKKNWKENLVPCQISKMISLILSQKMINRVNKVLHAWVTLQVLFCDK